MTVPESQIAQDIREYLQANITNQKLKGVRAYLNQKYESKIGKVSKAFIRQIADEYVTKEKKKYIYIFLPLGLSQTEKD